MHYLSILDCINEFAFEVDVLNHHDGVSRTCQWCGVTSHRVLNIPSQTMYVWDGKGDDPNADKMLCVECAITYTEDMNYQWDEYYRGRL